MITINGIELIPNSEYEYKYDYERLFSACKEAGDNEISLYRYLILNDLFFIVYFVLGMGKSNYKKINHPFIINACREVEEGAKSETLDIWAREHLKSSIITIAETIQFALKDSNKSTCIFSYARPVAKKFLFELKELFERNEMLKQCFPDVVWNVPANQAPIWSLDDGLILKRSGNRKEPTIYASGLIEGMPTGMHFNRMIFDDIVTEDIAESVDVMEKVKTKIDSAMNLGMDDGTHRVIGTFYHHNDPLVYLRDKEQDKKKLYKLRLKPATDNGLANGMPIFLSQARINFLKTTKTFNCQQLLNPTPIDSVVLRSSYLRDTDITPANLYRFMVIDPAGDNETKRGDSWGILLCGVEPKADDIGASNVYILDACIKVMTEDMAIHRITDMYLNGGSILRVGYEKNLNITPAWITHVQNYLSNKKKYVSETNNSLVYLKHGGRNKTYRISSALQFPLNNGKLFISNKVNSEDRNKIKNELDTFPYGHDDGIDALSYFYDVIKDFRFSAYMNESVPQYVPDNERIGY